MSDLSTVAGLLENAATGSGLVSVLAGGCEEVRVAELWRRSERAAAWFLETVGRDGAVGLLMETSLDCLVSLLGAWRAGVTTASCTGEASWLSRPSCGSEGGRDA